LTIIVGKQSKTESVIRNVGVDPSSAVTQSSQSRQTTLQDLTSQNLKTGISILVKVIGSGPGFCIGDLILRIPYKNLGIVDESMMTDHFNKTAKKDVRWVAFAMIVDGESKRKPKTNVNSPELNTVKIPPSWGSRSDDEGRF
jgi:hypothetical protein